MAGETASMLPLMLVNLLFAVVALGVGFAAGAWFFSNKSTSGKTTEEEQAEDALDRRLAMERAVMASGRLKDLANDVASDVGDHSTCVRQISDDLQAAKSLSPGNQEVEIASALTRIVAANDQLQEKLAKAEQQIKSQALEIETHESEARTDSLTQLGNRRAFDDELRRRYSEWERRSTPFSMIIADVDHFKLFNDTHGHQAGDEVLRAVAIALREGTRDMDVACRYGGEEFAILLPATTSKDACGLAERLRKSIEKVRVQFEGKELCVTTSVGVAQVNSDDDARRLVKRADVALYESKDAGRNNTHLQDGSSCVPQTPGKGTKKASPIEAAAEQVATATLDSMANRTKFSEELRRRVSESHRAGMPLSVMAVELTNYHILATEYGDAIAQMTLDSVAQFLKHTLRDMDLVAQTDSCQFMAMMPGTSTNEANEIGQRAADALANFSIPTGDGEIKLATSMSVAGIAPEDTAANLMERAAQKLAMPAQSATSFAKA